MDNKDIKIGGLVVYSTRGICLISNTETRQFGRESKDYFVLTPLFDERATYYIPVDFDAEKVHIKPALTKNEAKALLDFAKTAEPLEWIANPNERKQEYDWTYKAKSREDKIRLIKALSKHETEQKEAGRQLYASDSKILDGCLKIVSDELAYVLDKSPDEIAETLKS